MMKFNIIAVSLLLAMSIKSAHALYLQAPDIVLPTLSESQQRLHGLDLIQEGKILFSSNDDYVATRSLQGDDPQKIIGLFDNGEQLVYSLCATHAENRLATGSQQGVVRIFDVERHQLEHVFNDNACRSYVNELSWDKVGNLVLATPTSDYDPLTLWDRRSRKRILSYCDSKSINSAALSPSGKHIVIGYKRLRSAINSNIDIFDIRAQKVQELVGRDTSIDIKKVTYSADGNSLLIVDPKAYFLCHTVHDQVIGGVEISNLEVNLTDGCFNKNYTWSIVAGKCKTGSDTVSLIEIYDHEKSEFISGLMGGSGFTYVASCGATIAAFDRSESAIRIFNINNYIP